MKIIRNLILGAIAFAGLAVATPAQAYWHHYHYYHHYGPRIYTGITVGGPVAYGYNPYYYSPPAYPVYGYAPGFSIGFGGAPYYHGGWRWRHGHYWHHHH